MQPLKFGDRVEVVWPPKWAGYSGIVQVPLHTLEEGDRRIGVLLDRTGRVEWVSRVIVSRVYGVDTDW